LIGDLLADFVRALHLVVSLQLVTTIDAVSFDLLCDNNVRLRDTLIQCVRSKQTSRVPTMIQYRRMPHQIRHDCARKLQPFKKSGTFTAILGSLLDEDWTTPNVENLRITREHAPCRTDIGASDLQGVSLC
jgi:hypothetical protein